VFSVNNIGIVKPVNSEVPFVPPDTIGTATGQGGMPPDGGEIGQPLDEILRIILGLNMQPPTEKPQNPTQFYMFACDDSGKCDGSTGGEISAGDPGGAFAQLLRKLGLLSVAEPTGEPSEVFTVSCYGASGQEGCYVSRGVGGEGPISGCFASVMPKLIQNQKTAITPMHN